VRDARSAVLGRGDDLTELKQRLRPRVREALAQSLGQAAAQLYDAAGASAGSASGGDDDAAASGSRRGRRSGGGDRKGRGGAHPGERAASGASLERTDLRAWPEPDPPRSVETTVAGQTVTGYPTLVAVAPEKPGGTEAPR
ncbi:DUF3418 domain-containing protein, partial [Rhizobium leguminosarum]|nr:DUF3418 domain-containing protein [Rhizobium leguminosarum]